MKEKNNNGGLAMCIELYRERSQDITARHLGGNAVSLGGVGS